MWPRRGREREMQESRLKENMWGVSFYLALLAAHSNKVSPAVVSVLQLVYIVTSHWSLCGSSWTDCTAVMSQLEAESIRSQSSLLARRESLKFERIITWMHSVLRLARWHLIWPFWLFVTAAGRDGRWGEIFISIVQKATDSTQLASELITSMILLMGQMFPSEVGRDQRLS